MKKVLCLLILLTLIITGCSHNEGYAKKLIYDYYKKNHMVTSDSDVRIVKAKAYGDKYLVMSEYTEKEGNKCLDLLLIQKHMDQYSASRESQGILPSDSVFSLNKLEFDNSTILFGTFNLKNTENKSENIKCSKIIIKFTNGDSIEEKVEGEDGYIITVNKIVDVKEVTLLDQSGKTLSSAANIDSNQSLVNSVKFQLIR